jgi:AcrR family transcriptional regulator
MSPRPSKRDQLLDAALALVAKHGYSALTLDAVGAAVGVSKGGVLYHFPTKDALVIALIEQLGDGFDAAQAAALAEDSRMPGAATRAYLVAASTVRSDEHLAAVALLAAVGHDPGLLEPLRERYCTWVERLDNDGLPDLDAHLVRLAIDGLWAADLFGLAPTDPDLRRALLGRLLRLAGGAERGQL